MTTGSMLYLIMCVLAFGAFSAVLAFYSWQQSRQGREEALASARPEVPHGEFTPSFG